MISNVAVRVESEKLTGSDLSGLLGPSTWQADHGTPVSPRRPEGPQRKVTTWIKESSVNSDDLTAHVDSVQEVLDAAGRALNQGAPMSIDLTFMIEAQEMGSLVTLEPALLARLVQVGCGLVADVYNSDPD